MFVVLYVDLDILYDLGSCLPPFVFHGCEVAVILYCIELIVIFFSYWGLFVWNQSWQGRC